MMPVVSLVACLAAASPQAASRLSKQEALRQIAAHSCLLRLPPDAVADPEAEGGAAPADARDRELAACVASFPDVVVKDEGQCARYGVVGERLVFCQHAFVGWQQAHGGRDASKELAALTLLRARCHAAALCPQQAPKAASFRRR